MKDQNKTKAQLIAELKGIRQRVYESEKNEARRLHTKKAQREFTERYELPVVSVQQKEILLKEIHHRIKNNLQIISSLLDLKLNSANKKSTVELFKESQNQIRSISLVHEYLYKSEDLEQIDFGNYVQSLIEQLVYSYGLKSDNLNIKINIAEFMEVDQAIHCGLIINEMVSNSIKHAFKRESKPEIRIDLHCNKNKLLTLIVGDNGLGIPRSVDLRRTNTLGFQLIEALVKQLHGTIEMNRNGGSEFRIKFEKKSHQIATPVNGR